MVSVQVSNLTVKLCTERPQSVPLYKETFRQMDRIQREFGKL